MRKVKAVAIAVLTVLAAMIVARTAAGDDSIQAIEPQQITTADWQQVEPAQQIIETREPEARVEEITEPAYVPSTEATEGCISEAELIAITEEVGAMYDICPELLQALVERESTFYINATNGSCKGLAQISTRWHTDRMERLGVTDIYEPYGNILVAADYLRELFDEREDDDVYYVLMRYNMAIDTANSLYAAGEITDYARSIVRRAAELERLHGK
jgi:soluble lytic murein transglycosylase-like protein